MTGTLTRGFLMHLTHYDPAWVKFKHREKPFDLKLGLALIDQMADQGFDTLIVDVEDAVRYAKYPELRRGYSAPMSRWRRLAQHAQRRGLTVVPKLNFAKGVDLHNAWMSPYDEVPDTPRYFEHVEALVDEVIEDTGVRHLHIGMDEDDRDAATYLRVILTLRRLLARRKLRTVMWADIGHMWAPPRHVKTRAILERLPRDIVMMPWTYDHRSQAQWVKLLAGLGFTVWGGTGPDAKNMALWAGDIVRAGGHGLVLTMWVKLEPAQAAAQRRALRRAGRLFPRTRGES